jgi:S1-C subfamily serine protease
VRALIAALVLAAAAGCSLPTPEEKEASFAPLANTRVDGVLLRDFLAARTGALVAISGKLGGVTATATVVQFRVEGEVSLGAASAVAPDGYFLTAAHCVAEGERVYVPTGAELREVRVVLRDDVADFALVHVAGIRSPAFEWAEPREFADGASLVSLGFGGEEPGDSMAWVAAAGHAEGPPAPAARERPGAPPLSIVRHDVPLNRGDSGGPLATPAGRLVGINVRARAPFLFVPGAGYAVRPDPDWLAARIEEDRRARRDAR